MTKSEGWDDTLDDLDRRRQQAWAMGGAERLAKHHDTGKLDARARIERLLDKGTFRELGTLVGGDVAADAIVAGAGEINGTPVMVGAEDFTTMAGSIGPGGNSKRYRLAELALRNKIPLVMLLEGAGFRPPAATTGARPPISLRRPGARATFRPWPPCSARPPGTARSWRRSATS
jgi:acetyl-CoA carboxylase carboxyltransferase component